MGEQQNSFEGWAVIELFGHSREIGFVTTEHFGDKAMFRVEVPTLPAGERTTTRPEWIDGVLAQPGSVVKVEEVEGRTRYIGPGAVYAINPCDQAAAMRALQRSIPRTDKIVYLPPALSLDSGSEQDELDDEDEEETDDDGGFL